MCKFLFDENSWQHQYWNPDECTVVRLREGGFGVLDHSIQTLVATGDTQAACQVWLNQH